MDVFILATNRSWFLDFFRNIFAFIDSIVYYLIEILFKTIFNLANFELVGLYEMFETRIYVILGIFMLFKVAVSLISYLVNPDKINDKQEGAAKLVSRIMITLVMLISLPTFFNLATEFQNKLLPALPRLIIGEAKDNTNLSSSEATNVSRDMASTMLSGFAHIDSDCNDVKTDILVPSDIIVHINDKCASPATGSNIYKYDYLPIVSTIVGVVMCYVVFSLCITVAIRAFKLIILRMLAPIPVVSYINPKSSKDGMFSTWIKTFISTWVEVFILIGLIYFIVFIIDYILSADAWTGFFNGIDTPTDAILLLAFLIIGLLMFARQAPKFVFDALGIKNKGSFTRMLGMGAAAFGVGGTVASSIRERNAYDRDNGRNVRGFRNTAASLLSGIASASAAGNALLSSDKVGLRTGFDAQNAYNKRNLDLIGGGSTFAGRAGANISRLLTGTTRYDQMLKEKEANEKANKALLQYKNTNEKKALERKDLFVDVGKNGEYKDINYLEFMTNLSGAKNGDASSLQWFIDHGFTKQVQEGTQQVWDNDLGEYVATPVYKTVADWQKAELLTDDIKDKQAQLNAANMMKAIQNGDTEELSTKYGTEYNDYLLAADAVGQLGNLDVDFSTYKSDDPNKVGVKQALGETNRAITNIVTDSEFKAQGRNAKASQKSS